MLDHVHFLPLVQKDFNLIIFGIVKCKKGEQITIYIFYNKKNTVMFMTKFILGTMVGNLHAQKRK